MPYNIYVASSWKNPLQPELVQLLREHGHEVYDFRNPKEGETGFNWSMVDPSWEDWTVNEFAAHLQDPLCRKNFTFDYSALQKCDVVVLLLPSGNDAHSEAAWAKGASKVTIIHCPWKLDFSPGLMYKMHNALTSVDSQLLRLLELDPKTLSSKKL